NNPFHWVNYDLLSEVLSHSQADSTEPRAKILRFATLFRSDGKITLIADNGDILGTVDKAALTEDLNNDGLFTFTRNDGQDVVFDVNSVNVSEKLDADGNVIGYDFNDAAGNPITTVFTDATNNYYNNDNSGLTAENVQDAIDELADKLAEGAGVELKDEGDGKITLIAD